MYTITKIGQPTEAMATYGASLMRIVVEYDPAERAYLARLYVKSQPVDKDEARVPVHGRYADHKSAMDAAYGAGRNFVERFGKSLGTSA